MNVLQVIPAIAPRYGGPSETVISLARALIEAGVETEIATTDADGEGRLPVSLGTLTEFRSVPVRFFRRQFSEAFKFSRTLETWLQKEVGRFDVVHIHAVFSHSSVAASRACIRANIPYIVRPLGSLDPETYSCKVIRKRLFSALWGRRMLRDASAVHYTTEREKVLVEGRFALRHGFVAPAGVGLEDYRRAAVRPGSRDGDEAPYVVFLGRLDPIKRLELLIDAFSSVTAAPELRRWRLVVIGDGEPGYAHRLRARALRSLAGDRIEFTGWLGEERKAQVLEDAELLVLPSKHESFGRAAAEAMSLGVPVAITEEVFLADDVRRHGAGWVAQGTLDGVCRMLAESLGDPVARERAGRDARRLAGEQYSTRRSTELLLARYARLAGRLERGRG